MCKVDILLATYNGQQYIEEQLQSIIDQTYKNWRIIAHDDGSSDETMKILQEYQKCFPQKINVINDGIKFGCPEKNFSHLLTFSDSKYFAFCDQDDVWLPNKLECFLNEMEKNEESNKPILLYSDLIVVDQDLETINTSMHKSQKLPNSILTSGKDFIRVQNVVTGCAMLANRECKQYFFPISDDMLMHDWWLAIIALTKGKCIKIKEPTILYRQHGNNSVGFFKPGFSTIFKRINLKSIVEDFNACRKMSSAIDNTNISFMYYLYLKLVVIFLRFFDFRKTK